MCVLSIKVPIRKKSGNLFNDSRIFSRVRSRKLVEFLSVFAILTVAAEVKTSVCFIKKKNVPRCLEILWY